MDKDGFIYIVDRSKEILKCVGERVSCCQVEDRLLDCGGGNERLGCPV